MQNKYIQNLKQSDDIEKETLVYGIFYDIKCSYKGIKSMHCKCCRLILKIIHFRLFTVTQLDHFHAILCIFYL